jgi:hypothetical protein
MSNDLIPWEERNFQIVNLACDKFLISRGLPINVDKANICWDAEDYSYEINKLVFAKKPNRGTSD